MANKINDEIIEKCKDMYLNENLSCAEISRKIGIGEATIRRRLKQIGVEIIKYRNSVLLNPEEIINLYDQGFQIWKLAKMFKSSEETISKLLKANGVEVVRNGVRASFNHHIFDSIDTEEKAYWLGFIWADGCIINVKEEKKNYAFELGISIKDYDHLVKFCNFIGLSTSKIQIRDFCSHFVNSGSGLINSGKICRVQFSNEHFWNTLNNYGCRPNKTYNEIFPETSIFKFSNLLKHFIRGFFDGDGWVYLDQNKRIVTGLCGQECFLNKLQEKLPSMLRKKLYQQKDSIIYDIKWIGNNSIEFLNYIYDNATIYLDRKFNISAPYIRENISKLGKIGETPKLDNTEVSSGIAQGSETP